MKRIVPVFAVLAVVVAAGGFALFKFVGGEGGSNVEQWIGRLIVRVLENYITPKVAFDELDYQAPYGVSLKNLTLTHGEETMLAVDRVILELAESPSTGEPIQIKRIELDHPRLRFTQREDGTLVGWGEFVRDSAVEQPESVPEGSRLSDVLVLRHVAMREGEVVFAPTGADAPMVLPGITMELNTPSIPDEPGWYALDGTFSREPIFSVTMDGRVNLDTTTLEFASLALQAELGPEQYESFPPPLQQMLRDHEVRGDLEVTANAVIPVSAPTQTAGTFDVVLTEANVTIDQYVLPIELFKLTANAAEGAMQAEHQARLLGGTFGGAFTLGLDAPNPFDWNWKLAGLKIEDTLRVVQEDDPPYAGLLGGGGAVRAELANLPASLAGEGTLALTEGRLVEIPVVKALVTALELVKLPGLSKHNDKANADFRLKPDHIALDAFDVQSGTMRVYGDGTVTFTQQLDLNVKAGLLDSPTRELGAVGDILRSINEKVVAYQVTGPVSDPKVTVKPLDLK